MLNVALFSGEDNIAAGVNLMPHVVFMLYFLVGMPLASDGKNSMGASKRLSQGLDVVRIGCNCFQEAVIILLFLQELLSLL